MSDPRPDPRPSPAGSTDAGHRRKLRNFVLAPKFQLRYATLLVAIAWSLMASLGAIIWQTATTASQQARTAVLHAEHALSESRANAALMGMERLQHADNPELVQAIQDQLREVDQQAEASLAAVHRQQQEIEQTRWRMRAVLWGALFALSLVLAATGIVFTHRVAGPVFKIKRLLGDVSGGPLRIQGGLRRGDELLDLFEALVATVDALRARVGRARAGVKAAEATLARSGTHDEAALAALRDADRVLSDLTGPDA